MPELVSADVGHLSNREDELVNAVLDAGSYSRKRCHEYARDEFNSKKMTLEYLKKYERVLQGETLNEKPPSLLKVQKEKLLKWD